MTTHQKSVHQKLRPFACTECGKSLSTKQGLDRHLVVHSGDRHFSCPKCYKKFNRKGNLDQHLKCVHVKAKEKIKQKSKWKNVCYFCHNKFVSPSGLEKHLITHTKETPLFCSVCSKGFRRNGNLVYHKRTHFLHEFKEELKSKFKYQCNFCQKRFQVLSALKTHINSHTKENHFSCDICTKTFTTQSDLTRHIKIVHQNILPFLCNTCRC